ncbi:hypothetical protein OS493_024039 [Desmophyllum pertusum]|uniref:Uncharacterized protein n=1 Tax=Desmophyllum pertusum TaxID=174260 RepID=A0A9X0D1T3_9CNID|nr:hypothetical protein OS493_024039 [Desmophyllum pertusum]
MVFESGCCCPQHEEWGFGHVGLKKLFAITYREEKFCSAGRWSLTGNKDRKRKICGLCRKKIQLQTRCEALEAASSSQIEFSPALEDNQQDEVCDVLDDPVENDSFPEHSEGKYSEDKACQVPETASSARATNVLVPEGNMT